MDKAMSSIFNELKERMMKNNEELINEYFKEHKLFSETYKIACKEILERYQKVLKQVENITYEPLLGTGLCENCRVPKMTNSGNGVDEPTNPVLYCHKESLIIEPVPEGEQTAECAGFEPCA